METCVRILSRGSTTGRPSTPALGSSLWVMTVLVGRRPKGWLGEQLEKLQPMVLIEIIKKSRTGCIVRTISPEVRIKQPLGCAIPDNVPTSRAPVLPIEAPATTTLSSSPSAPSHIGIIAGAVTGSVVAVLVVIAAIAFVRRRRRLRRRKSVQSSILGSFVGVGPPATITPFDPICLDATSHGSDSRTEGQELLSIHPDAGSALDSYSLSSTSTPAMVIPLSQPVAPVPTGLSSKELARLRTEALSSQNTVSPQSPDTPQPSSPPTAVTEQSGAIQSSEAQRLQSEVESLRREMQRILTERLESPPSYTSGDA